MQKYFVKLLIYCKNWMVVNIVDGSDGVLSTKGSYITLYLGFNDTSASRNGSDVVFGVWQKILALVEFFVP